jgi:hypothetical protein
VHQDASIDAKNVVNGAGALNTESYLLKANNTSKTINVYQPNQKRKEQYFNSTHCQKIVVNL